MAKEKTKLEAKSENVAVAVNTEKVHSHGKVFEGIVKKKFPKRVVIEFARTVYVRKYERYAMSKTKIHARLPVEMESNVNVGDLIKVQECRPLSRIIHFVVVQKLKDASEFKTKEKKE